MIRPLHLFWTGIVICFLSSALLVLDDDHDSRTRLNPAPTNGETQVRLDGETGHEREKREAWLDLMHRTAPGTDWHQMEYQNQVWLAGLRKDQARLRGSGDQEILADGKLIGRWNERGSLNQAGSVVATTFDQESEEIWLVSAGGSIFKGSLAGSDWQVVNQDYKFNDELLQFVPTSSGRRLLAIINKIVHYSDDDGQTWQASEGMTTYDNNWGARRYPIVLDDSLHTIYYLVQEWLPGPWKSDVGIYRSQDLGETFEKVVAFNSGNINAYCLARIKGTNEVAMLEKNGPNKTTLYVLDPDTGLPVQAGQTIIFGIGDERSNLEAIRNGNQTTYYTFNSGHELFKSTDDGQTWDYISTFSKNPWSVGVFVSETNPDFMLMGEVECHRSVDGGQNWNIYNPWWAYYDDVEGSLHADMMYFAEYKKKDGTPFFLVSNHGGLNVTYDGSTFDNLGLSGLNVSQYYDVVTDPIDELYIYAGSQDQGFQRGMDLWEGDVLDFEQAISGDYGHMVFTGNGQHLWMVYPGGWVSYWDYPVSGGVTAGFTIDSEDESVWIPPMIADPDQSKNVVYIAGGNLSGGSGSHILRLEVVNFEIEVEELPFDFKDYSGGEVSALAFSPFDPDVLYAATTNGYFFTSLDKGQTWDQGLSTVPGGQYLYGAAILPSKTDPGTIYFGGSGYSGPAMLVSTNGGQSFTSMNNGLPPTLVIDLAANDDESLIFAATETGPFVYVKADDTWYPMLGGSAPVQTYWSVEFLPLQQTVRFGTYGRGIWDFAIEEVVAVAYPRPSEPVGVLSLFPNPVYGANLTARLGHLTKRNCQWQIMDLQGNTCLSDQASIGDGADLSIQLPKELVPGVYVLEVIHAGQRLSGKWVRM